MPALHGLRKYKCAWQNDGTNIHICSIPEDSKGISLSNVPELSSHPITM